MTKYPWQAIDPKSFIQIESTNTLTMQNVHVLTKLYQPIIGGSAYSLYLTLFGETQFSAHTKGVTVSELLRKLDIGIPDFYKARIRLEGIGLLRVYRSQENNDQYFYQLVRPLTAQAFFKDSLFRTLLIEKVGERLFNEEIAHFLPDEKDKTSYGEITRSFLDVYHFDVNNTDVLSQTDFMPIESQSQPKLAETIENVDSFDYNFFKAGLNKHFVRQESFTKEIKELIYTFHIVYGIDEMTMQALILESADIESGEVNKNKFVSNVQRAYLNKQQTQTQKSPQVLNQPNEQTESKNETKKEGTTQNLTATETSVISHAKQTAPANYLRSIKDQKGGFVTSNETWVLKELVESSRLSKDVINILLHYILVVKGAVVLEKNYAMKIANDWAQSGVRTPEQAIQKVKELYNQAQNKNAQPKKQNNSYQNNYRKNRKKETLPDWAQDDKKQTTDDEQVSTQDEDALKIRLEQIRRMRQQKEGDN